MHSSTETDSEEQGTNVQREWSDKDKNNLQENETFVDPHVNLNIMVSCLIEEPDQIADQQKKSEDENKSGLKAQEFELFDYNIDKAVYEDVEWKSEKIMFTNKDLNMAQDLKTLTQTKRAANSLVNSEMTEKSENSDKGNSAEDPDVLSSLDQAEAEIMKSLEKKEDTDVDCSSDDKNSNPKEARVQKTRGYDADSDPEETAQVSTLKNHPRMTHQTSFSLPDDIKHSSLETTTPKIGLKFYFYSVDFKLLKCFLLKYFTFFIKNRL